ncbi:MAG: hypothetical protein ABSH50_11690 [Bryobacteraceae bacterium]|jgi:hypothetical protein
MKLIAVTFLATWAAVCAPAQTLQVFDSASAGTAAFPSVAALTTSGQFVTAIENSNLDLEVIAWQNNTASRSISRLGSLSAGKLGAGNGPNVAVAGVSNDRFVVALINANGNLELILYAVNPNTTITRLDSVSESLPINGLAITALDSQRVVTVATDSASATVTTWIVNSNNTLSAQAIPWVLYSTGYSVAVAAMSSSQIAVAQDNGVNADGAPNQLSLSTFSVDSMGDLLELSAYFLDQNGYVCGNDDGPFCALSIASLGGGNLAVDSQDDSGTPTVSLWNISASGLITAVASGQEANSASAVAVVNMQGMAFTIDDSDNYLVSLWGGTQGINYDVVTTALPGGCVGYCNVAAASLPGGEVVTATITGNNFDLTVSVWLLL